jgi:hypothetical protein
MIAVLRDESGNITAVCEWLWFDNAGRVTEDGELIFIGELEVNPGHENSGCLKGLLKQVIELAPNAKEIFWFRESKYPGRKHRLFNIETLKKRLR